MNVVTMRFEQRDLGWIVVLIWFLGLSLNIWLGINRLRI